MAWRKRYNRGGGGNAFGLAKKIAGALRRQDANFKKWKRTKKMAARGRVFTKYLRTKGIGYGDGYLMDASGVSALDIPKGQLGVMRKNAAANTFIGRGAYSFGKAWRNVVGKHAGRQLRGAVMDKVISNINGSGMYSGRGLYGRGSYNGLIEGGRPSMSLGGSGDETQSLVISHSEYLQDVFGAPNSNFNVEDWNLNPGLLENFPWLAQLACNYEEYEFIQLLFSFKSTVDASAINNTNGSTGTIIMATNYNPTAPTFPNKETMMQYHGANSGRIVDDHTHGVECDPSKNAGSAQKYIRTTPAVPGQDLKTFDLGKFQLAQVNLPSAFFNQQIGELWVTYTVKLTKPRLYGSLTGQQQDCRWVQNAGTTIGTGPSGQNLTGTVLIKDIALANSVSSLLTMVQSEPRVSIRQVSSSASGSYTNGTGQTGNVVVGITFPDFCTGVFQVEMFMEGNLLACSVTDQVLGNVAYYNDLYGTGSANTDAPSWAATLFNSTQTMYIGRFRVQPVTAGVDNEVRLTLAFAANAAAVANAINQIQFRVSSQNPFIGQSAVNPAPLYQNSVGVLVDPSIV